jgi:nucleoside-diphosphate-sugar epimerase
VSKYLKIFEKWTVGIKRFNVISGTYDTKKNKIWPYICRYMGKEKEFLKLGDVDEGIDRRFYDIADLYRFCSKR